MDLLFQKAQEYHSCNYHHLNRYIAFIESRSRRICDLYTEKHHIIPRCMGGTDENNLIKLSSREHFIAHYMLAKAFGGTLWFAVNIMACAENPYQCRRNFKINSRLYHEMRMNMSRVLSDNIRLQRNNESQDEIQARVDKWRENRNNKSAEELQASIDKQVKSRMENKNNGLHKEFEQTRILCEECGKEIHIHHLKRHLESHERSREAKIQRDLIMEAVIKEKQILKEEKKKKQIQDKLDAAAARKMIKKALNEEKKRIRKADRDKNLLVCPKCGRRFRLQSAYDKHIDICGLTREEILVRAAEKRKATMDSKTPEEIQSMRDKLSKNISASIQRLDPEQREKRNQRTREAMLNYYNSDDYDPEKRSEEIKRGLRHDN